MIELAYFVASLDKIKLFKLRHLSRDNFMSQTLQDYLQHCPSATSLTWYEDHLAYIEPSASFSRFYFGNEFCQTLIPSVEDLESMIHYCKKTQMALSLVTPMFLSYGIEKVQKLIKCIQENQFKAEVIINDFGALRLCLGIPEIQPVLGRGLMKQPSRVLLDRLIHEFQITRLEFDVSRHGYLVPDPPTLPTSVYFPWVVRSTQRQCPIGHIHHPVETPIPVHPQCEYQCQLFSQGIQSFRGTQPQSLFQKGTTTFELVKPDIQLFTQLNKTARMNRIVYQPSLPF